MELKDGKIGILEDGSVVGILRRWGDSFFRDSCGMMYHPDGLQWLPGKGKVIAMVSTDEEEEMEERFSIGSLIRHGAGTRSYGVLDRKRMVFYGFAELSHITIPLCDIIKGAYEEIRTGSETGYLSHEVWGYEGGMGNWIAGLPEEEVEEPQYEIGSFASEGGRRYGILNPAKDMFASFCYPEGLGRLTGLIKATHSKFCEGQSPGVTWFRVMDFSDGLASWLPGLCEEVKEEDAEDVEEVDEKWTSYPDDEIEDDGSILLEAFSAVRGDRQTSYGPPEEDFARTADMWTAMFAGMLKDDAFFRPFQVAQAMIAVKLSRQTHAPKRDNWVDIAGYAQCGAMCDAKQKENDHADNDD